MKNSPTPLPASRELHSSPFVRRYAGNPILTARDVPYAADYVFNAGAAFYRGEYFIAPRIDCRNRNYHPGAPRMRSICTGFGRGRDGIRFVIDPEPVRVHYRGEILPWVCDARLTVLEDELYLSFCFENRHSERPGIARWRGSGTDFDTVCLGVPQQRNMILCPFKNDGLYMRLERPSNQWQDPFHIWYSLSPDLRYWGDSELLLGCEDVPFADKKIGGGAPMVEIPQGYLLIFHAVDEDPARTVVFPDGRKWCKRYTAGAALFDRNDPTTLTAITKKPLLVAEAPYETGDLDRLWVEFTVFPCGALLTGGGKNLRIYYGAGDCSTNIADIALDDLMKELTPCSRKAERATIPFDLAGWKN
ncbi:MAG: glycosidase [Lentisphaeria bacterium]|nr:glycosidase [Lentisphaeria bacterium]